MNDLRRTGFLFLLLVSSYILFACQSQAVKKMYAGKERPDSEIALIAGQNIGNVQVRISKVEHKNVYTEWSVKFHRRVYVEPGKHTLEVTTYIWQYKNQQEIDVEVEAGKAYEINPQLTEVNGQHLVTHHVLEIGSIADYFKKYPDARKGSN